MQDKIQILYEDDDCAVISKPSGTITHFDGHDVGYSVADWVLDHYPQSENAGEPFKLQNGVLVQRPGIVHRLDRETSGAMIVVKRPEAFQFFKTQFQNHEIKKIYHLFVYGRFKEKEGTIDRSIARSRSDFRLWSAQRGARGKGRQAITTYRIMAGAPFVSFVEASPKTGRTHQLRAHFKAIHHPIVCDKLYAPNHDPMLGLERLALHSYILRFRTTNGSSMEIVAPYPDDFRRAVEEFRKL